MVLKGNFKKSISTNLSTFHKKNTVPKIRRHFMHCDVFLWIIEEDVSARNIEQKKVNFQSAALLTEQPFHVLFKNYMIRYVFKLSI